MADPGVTEAGLAPGRRTPSLLGWLGIAVVVGLSFVGGIWAKGPLLTLVDDLRAGPPEEVAPSAVTLRRIRALGEILPQSDVLTVAAPTGQDVGRIAEIRVDEGDVVRRGDILAVLDTEPLLKAKLAQAIANAASRQVALDALSADLSSEELQLAAQMNEQRVAREKAQVELDRRTQLRDTGLYEDAALVDLRLNLESAELALRNSELRLNRTRLRNAAGLRLDEATARADLDAAIAARDVAEAEHAKALVRAPIDGRILAINGRLGEQIDSAGFADIGDTSGMQVRAEVYETDAAEIAPGQTVTIESRAVHGALTGKVARTGIRISAQSILSTDPAAIVDARVVEVWIALDAASASEVADLSGLQVTVTFGDGDT